MLLLFIDLAVRLDANIEEDEKHVDDDAAIQALMAETGKARGQAPSAGRHSGGRQFEEVPGL